MLERPAGGGVQHNVQGCWSSLSSMALWTGWEIMSTVKCDWSRVGEGRVGPRWPLYGLSAYSLGLKLSLNDLFF